MHDSRRPRFLGMVGYFLIVLGPLLYLSGTTFLSVVNGDVSWGDLGASLGRRSHLLVNSFGLALITAVIAMVIGWVAAVSLWSCRRRIVRFVLWCILPLLAMPPYIHALTWLNVVSQLNVWLRSFAWAPFVPYGWSGVIWVEVATFAPLTLGFSWLGLRNIDPELIETARMINPDIRSLFHIALPLSVPALLTGGGIVFLMSLLDYGVPSLLQVNVYAMEIFTESAISKRPEQVFLLATLLMAVSSLVLAGLLKPLRSLTLRQTYFGQPWANPPRWPRWFSVTQRGVWVSLVVVMLLPVFTLMALVGNPAQLTPALVKEQPTVLFSLWTSLMAGILSIVLSISAARALVSARHASMCLWLMIMAPLALPAPLIGLSLTALASRIGLRNELALDLLPALGHVIRFTPLATLIMVAQLRRTDSLLFEAAEIFQPSCMRRQLQVVMPLLGPGLLAAGGLVFALSMGELGTTLMVVPPGRTTLTMQIYNYLHYGASRLVAGLCFLLLTSVIGASVVTMLGVKLCLRPGNPHEDSE